MAQYLYEKIDLDRKSVRLLRLLKNDGIGIIGHMYSADLEDDNSYEALSYTWGGETKTEQLIVNGITMSVTRNLYRALLHLRKESQDRILWVDAICIDQSNTRERGHQVANMKEIYKRAENVIFWLGLSSDGLDPNTEVEIESFMDHVSEFQEHCRDHVNKSWTVSDPKWQDLWNSIRNSNDRVAYDAYKTMIGDGLQKMLNRPWFERVWILQEVGNARAAEICCGKKTVRARFFAMAPKLAGLIPSPQRQAVLDIMPGWTREQSWWQEKSTFWTIAMKFESCKATDPRDMIFALAAISSDTDGSPLQQPDYSKAYHKVIEDAGVFLFPPYGTPARNFHSLLRGDSTLGAILGKGQMNRLQALLDAGSRPLGVNGRVLVCAAGHLQMVNDEDGMILRALSRHGVLKQLLGMNKFWHYGHFKWSKAAWEASTTPPEIGSSRSSTYEQSKESSWSPTAMIDLLIRRKERDFTLDNGAAAIILACFTLSTIQMLFSRERLTEDTSMLEAAALNTHSGKAVFEWLDYERPAHIRITAKLLFHLHLNLEQGLEVIISLTQNSTEDVIDALIDQLKNERVDGEYQQALMISRQNDSTSTNPPTMWIRSLLDQIHLQDPRMAANLLFDILQLRGFDKVLHYNRITTSLAQFRPLSDHLALMLVTKDLRQRDELMRNLYFMVEQAIRKQAHH